MVELIQANWPLFLAALLIGIAVAWFVFNATRRTKVQTDKRDVLDEGAEAAARNQALIDAPPAAATAAEPPPTPVATPAGLAGAGAAVSAAATEPAPAPDPAPAPGGDDLSRIKGVGPKLVAMLKDMGVNTFAEIAAWGDADIDRVDAQLGRFSGRIRRDDWVRQAKLLSAGDMAAYEAAFGKI